MSGTTETNSFSVFPFLIFFWIFPFSIFLIFSFFLFFFDFSLSIFLIFYFFHLGLLSIASQTHFHLFIWTYSLSPVKLIFISGLTFNGQFSLFSHLGLPLTASSLHFHIWAYLYRPVFFISISGLTSNSQFSSFSIWAFL